MSHVSGRRSSWWKLALKMLAVAGTVWAVARSVLDAYGYIGAARELVKDRGVIAEAALTFLFHPLTGPMVSVAAVIAFFVLERLKERPLTGDNESAWAVLIRVEQWHQSAVYLHIVNRSRSAKVALTFKMLVEADNGKTYEWHHCGPSFRDPKSVIEMPLYASLGPGEDTNGRLEFHSLNPQGNWNAKAIRGTTLEISEHVSGKTYHVTGLGSFLWT